MKTQLALSFALIGAASIMVGCIHHEETIYRDPPRANVEFESDRAARIFYDAFHEHGVKADSGESKTEFEIPVVFHDKRRVVTGPNASFNRAVEICDANHDGRITEQEARIYAEHRR